MLSENQFEIAGAVHHEEPGAVYSSQSGQVHPDRSRDGDLVPCSMSPETTLQGDRAPIRYGWFRSLEVWRVLRATIMAKTTVGVAVEYSPPLTETLKNTIMGP